MITTSPNSGTSSGLGHRLVQSVLARGDLVVATARSLEKIKDFPPSANLRLLQLDVNDAQEVIQAHIDEAVKFWGRIDVLVNNAGMSFESITRGSTDG